MSQIVIDFILQNTTKIATALFCAVAFATFVNLVINPFSTQCKKFKKGIVLLKKCAFGQSVFRFVENMPKEYLNQWKCFTKTPDVYPSEIFEFVHKKPRSLFGWVYFVVGVCSVIFVLVFLFVQQDSQFLLIALTLAISLCLSKNVVSKKNKASQRKTERLFDKWIVSLDAFFGKDFDFENMGKKIADSDLNDVISSFDLLKQSCDGQTLQKIANLLQSKGLNGQRTVAQQQKLNLALNQRMVQCQKINSTEQVKDAD